MSLSKNTLSNNARHR